MAGQTARKLAETTSAAARRASKAVTKRTAASGAGKKTAAKPVPAQKAAPKRAPAQAAKKVPAAQAAEPTTTGSSARKAPAPKAATRKSPPKKAAVTKPASTKPASTKTPSRKVPAQKAAARKAPSPRTPSPKAPAGTAVPTKVVARQLAVKAGEKPWTTAELAEVRGELAADRARLLAELNLVEHEIQDLMRDAGDGAGNDQADVGSTTFERDHEMSLANNARHMLAQTERALSRIDDGSYGVCESCGEPIGKMRVMAFPRATLCLSCKQREERR
jgi:RNA polymerase-binding protein DksA